MMTLRRLDDRLLADVNDLTRHTHWLHGAVLGSPPTAWSSSPG